MSDLDKIREITDYLDAHWKHGRMPICKEDVNMGIQDIISNFYFEKFKWCGCGDPSAALKAVKKYLYCADNDKYENRREKFKREFGVECVYDNELLLCLAYTLDAYEITEHGTSIGGAWLTKEGEYLKWCLDRVDLDNFDLS